MNIIIQILSIVFWFVIILVPLVALHELGHLLFSKLFGVKIPEYAIGLPLTKRTFYFRWKGTIWSFYWPLLGGFVRIHGDNDAIDEAYETAKVDPKKAREDYVPSRFQEILTGQELKFFLESSSLEYDAQWQWFEKAAEKGVDDDRNVKLLYNILITALNGSVNFKNTDLKFDSQKVEITEKYEKMYNQLATLIDWEYDQNIDSKNTFFHKNWIQQTLIISGGIIFNFLTAFSLFWIIFSFLGVNNTLYPIDNLNNLESKANLSSKSDYATSKIIEGSKAAEIGMKSGDELYKFAGVEIKDIKSQDQFKQLVLNNKNKEIEVEYRSKSSKEYQVKKVLIEEKNGEVIFGVSTILREISYKAKNPIVGISMATDQTVSVTEQTSSYLVEIIKALFPGQNKEALNYVGGPIAVGSVGSEIFALGGVTGILNVMAAVSISLAIFNLLPIPALDGGRWVILTINKITGKRNRKLEAAIISTTFLLMIGLALVIALRDIQGVSVGKFKLQ
jgi:regulator of sigma E protease